MIPTVDDLVNDPLNASLPAASTDAASLLSPLLQNAASRDAGACWIYVDRIDEPQLLCTLATLLARSSNYTYDAIRSDRFGASALRAWWRVCERLAAARQRGLI